MSKRSEYLNSLEQSKKKALETVQEKTTSVDETIRALEKNVVDEKPAETKPVKLNKEITLNLKPREFKRVHKSFLIPSSINDKLSALSKQSGVSENEIINELLRKAFSE